MTPGELYHFQITSVNGAGLSASTADDMFVTQDLSGFQADDFNRCEGLAPFWTFVDPQGDATLDFSGVGTADAYVEIGVPAGSSHQLFDTLDAPRIMQAVNDVDFEIEVKFDSDVLDQYQIQGILVQQDAGNWLRFDLFPNGGGNIGYYAGNTLNGDTAQAGFGNTGITAAPMWLRVGRAGNQWTMSWSDDGSSFTQVVSFSRALTVQELGLYSGNSVGASAPAHTTLFDYVVDTSSPFGQEDGTFPGSGPFTLTRNTVGSGSITADPDQPQYFCTDSVTLTAAPDFGFMFDRWEGDLTGTVNPQVLAMDANKTVTAVFVQDVDPPVISNIQVSSSADSAIVSWQTDEPATSVVDYGDPSCALQESNASLVTQHAIQLSGLTPLTTYCFSVTSADALGQSSSSAEMTFDTTAAGFESDDFNTTNLDLSRWSLVDPIGGGRLQLVGTGTADAHLVLTVPGGGPEYAPWLQNDSLRVLQDALDEDFRAEAKFESDLTLQNQEFGIMVEEVPDTWIRFDFDFDGSNVNAYAAGITNGTLGDQSFNLVLNGALVDTPIWMAVERSGNTWTQEYSLDGMTWIQVNVITHVLSVARVGPWVGNEGANPPQTEAAVDWFFNANSPIAPEDFGTPPDPTSPFLYRATASGVNESSISLNWATDEPASAMLEYGLTNAFELGVYGSFPSFEYEHSTLVTGLDPDTTYFFRVTSEDAAFNQAFDDTLSATTTTGGNLSGPQFVMFTGQEMPNGESLQRFGHLGTPQQWVNIIGNTFDVGGSVVSLTYQLNGGPVTALSLGTPNPAPFRLTQVGDFNAEIDFVDLLPGTNTVVLTAMDNDGNTSAKVVRIDYTSGVVWPQSYAVDWSTVTDLQDVSQVVDGHWTVDDDPFIPGQRVLRTLEMGYDRLVDIGEVTWEDYEVRFDMTVHQLDPNGFTPGSNSYAVGFILRWTGHTVSSFMQQPRVGFFPFGGVFVYRWFPTEELWDHYGTDFTPRRQTMNEPIEFGVRHQVRGRVETLPDGQRRYQLRVWEDGQSEPGTWLIDVNHPAGHGNATGSFLFLAHHVDVSFGNVTFTELP